jgi:hypothetical protein
MGGGSLANGFRHQVVGRSTLALRVVARHQFLLVVTRAVDVGMKDRRAVCGLRGCGVSNELVVEDGADRAVGERADHDRATGGRFRAGDTARTPNENAEA